MKFQALSFPVHGTQKVAKLRIADFVGNQNFPPPATKPIDQSAAAFLVEQANLYPGQVTIVALGPLTNLALVWSAFPCLCTALDASTTAAASVF
jgi:inosine-uridine nucleoside N-ribohydrolase